MKRILANLALTFLSVTLTLGVIEAGFRFIPTKKTQANDQLNENAPITKKAQIIKMEGEYSSGKYFRHHNELGYGPVQNQIVTSRKIIDDEVIYDATYSINEYGLREVSPLSNKPLFLFFGGSFTFGEGINDNETLPYLFLKAAGNKYDVLNFGFHGYGPHQMLRALEIQMPNQISQSPVKSIIFQTGAFHVLRSAGLSPWDKTGPKYIVTKENNIKYNGPFANKYIVKRTQQITKRSKLAAYLFDKASQAKQSDPKTMVDIYVGILKQAKNLAETEYKAPFIVLFWDDVFKIKDVDITPDILEQLEKHNFTIIKTSEVFDSLSNTEQKQLLIKQDGHPNSRANTLTAQALVRTFQNNGTLS